MDIIVSFYILTILPSLNKVVCTVAHVRVTDNVPLVNVRALMCLFSWKPWIFLEIFLADLEVSN